eukprot:scaffold7926_cov147-Skeletonema_marinoi.AAC.1
MMQLSTRDEEDHNTIVATKKRADRPSSDRTYNLPPASQSMTALLYLILPSFLIGLVNRNSNAEAESLRIVYSGYSGTPNTNPIQKDDDQEAMTNKAKRAMVGTNGVESN